MSRKILFQEADFYGASNLVFQEENLPCCYKASWMHGLGPVLFRDKTSSSVLLHYYERDLPIHLVNNSSTVDLLQLEGVDSVAVGMPFIYTDAYSSCNIRRVYKRLFMPSHRIGGKSQKEEYADWLSIIKKYGCDSICVGLNDYKYIKKNNVQFEGVEVLMGAYSADMDSLERVSLMLKSTYQYQHSKDSHHL